MNYNENYSITEYNKAFENFSLTANVLAPFLSDAFYKVILDVFSCCNCVKYIKHRCTSTVLNVGCNFEKFLSNYWTEIAISLFNLLSIKNGWVWLSLATIPAMLWFCLRVFNYGMYAINYCRYNKDINRLRGLYDNNNIQDIIGRGVLMHEIIQERKCLFESLTNRGKIDKLIYEGFSFTQTLDVGVQDVFLLRAIPIGYAQRDTLQNAIERHNAIPHPVHVIEIQINVAQQHGHANAAGV